MVAGRLRRLAGSGYGYGTLKMNGRNESDDDETTPMQRNEEPGDRLRRTVEMAIKAKRRSKLKDRLREGAEDVYVFEEYRKSDGELKAMDKKVRAFYEEQNKRLDDWIEVNAIVKHLADDVLDSFDPQDLDGDGIAEQGGALQTIGENIELLLPDDERQRRRRARRNARWAININVVANVLLLAAKIVAAFYSDSLSLIASLVDSGLDLLCTLIIWTTSKLVTWKLKSLSRRFPVGRRRLEPIGIVVFSIIMIVSFIQILQESAQKLLPGGQQEAPKLPVIAIAAMAATIGVKGVIWFGCMPVKTTQVQALAQDCKTDVLFNSLSLLFPLIGHQANIWWLDALGAALLSLFIIYDWASTCIANIARLTGAAVEHRLLQKVVFLAWRFAPLVDAFKTVRAYHTGDGAWVEIDMLLDAKTPLDLAHDTAETCQLCLEALQEVDRAFVTVDYATQGPTGHAPTD